MPSWDSILGLLTGLMGDRRRERRDNRRRLHEVFAPVRDAAVEVEDCLACAASPLCRLDRDRYGRATATLSAEFPQLDCAGDPEIDALETMLCRHHATEVTAGTPQEQCQSWQDVFAALAALERTLHIVL
jgi:hypothetical protein